MEPFSYASTAYVVASALVSVRLFCKNLGNLQNFLGQMVYRPPSRNISPYAYGFQPVLNDITQHTRHRKCERLPPTNFHFFYLKKRDQTTNLFDQFHITVMFYISFCLDRACFTHLISSNLSCNLCLWYFDQLVHLNKEINANVYRHSLWEYSKCFHCSFEQHLTPLMTLSIETCIRWTPCIKRTLQHSPLVQFSPQL